MAEPYDSLKWQQKDTLRSMTSKHNDTVDQLESLSESSTQVNQATEEKFTNLEQSISKQFQQVNEELEQKVSSVTAEDIGLGNVDNTSDVDKPVSTAQQKALDDAKEEAMAEQLTSIEEETIPSSEGDPEVSPSVQALIEEKIIEIGAQSGVTSYGIASKTAVGVVKASEEVSVEPETGKMGVVGYEELKQTVSNMKNSLDSNNQATQKILDNQGTMESLSTTNKTSLVDAVNEVFQLGSEKKAKLVENLTAMGITCSTGDTWETLLGYILTIFTGTDTSDANFLSEDLVQGKIAYGVDGKVTGTLPDFYGSYHCNGTWRDDAQGVHFTIPTTGRWNKDKVNIYASYQEVAENIGLSAGMFLDSFTVLGMQGLIPNLSNRYSTQYSSDNSTPVIKSDAVFWGDNTDGVSRLCYRWNGESGYLGQGTLIGYPISDLANALGVTSEKILNGYNLLGVPGTAQGAPDKAVIWESSGDTYESKDFLFTEIPYTYVVLSCYTATVTADWAFIGCIIKTIDQLKMEAGQYVYNTLECSATKNGFQIASKPDKTGFNIYRPVNQRCTLYGVNNIEVFK